jgi:hypothetical protein
MRILIIGFLVLAVLPAIAQNYLPATMELKDHSVKSGSVKYKNFGSTLQEVHLRMADGKQSVFHPADLLRLDITRTDQHVDRFVSRVVWTNVSPDKSSQLDDNHVPKMKKDTLLLQVMIQGSMSLYEWRDLNGKTHFFAERDSVEELIYKRFVQFKNDQKFILENKQFLQQINRLFGDCPEVRAGLATLTYFVKDFVKVFEQAESCGLTVSSYKYQTEHYKPMMGIVLGAAATHFAFQVSDADFNKQFPYDGFKYSPLAGLNLEFYIRRTNLHGTIVNELSYRSFQTESVYYDYTLLSWKSYLKMTHLRDCVMGRYYVFRKKQQRAFFVEGGGVVGCIISNKSHLLKEYYISNTDAPYLNDPNNFDLGFTAGMGIRLNRLTLEGRYERTTRTMKTYPATSFQILTLTAGYRLF